MRQYREGEDEPRGKIIVTVQGREDDDDNILIDDVDAQHIFSSILFGQLLAPIFDSILPNFRKLLTSYTNNTSTKLSPQNFLPTFSASQTGPSWHAEPDMQSLFSTTSHPSV